MKPKPPLQRIKILSYNIHWGLSAFRKHAVEERLVQTIIREKSDIVLLQELWLPEDLALLSMLDHLRQEWAHRISGPTVQFAKGLQGNGMLSRYPFISWSNEPIVHPSTQARAMLHARLQLSEQLELSVICTHFGLSRRERELQAKQLCDYVEGTIPKQRPLVIGGDFNDWRAELSPYFERRLGLREAFLASSGRHARSFPAIWPLLCLDRVYTRHLEITQARVVKEAGWHGSSDHLPLAVELAFREKS